MVAKSSEKGKGRGFITATPLNHPWRSIFLPSLPRDFYFDGGLVAESVPGDEGGYSIMAVVLCHGSF